MMFEPYRPTFDQMLAQVAEEHRDRSARELDRELTERVRAFCGTELGDLAHVVIPAAEPWE